MIRVHKIDVVNIRSLGHAVFEPLVDGGMTAVNGPNGAGKTSLLAAMLWAIFGVTPDGVPQTAMRRQGSEGTCRVIVDFEYDGQIVTVERGLKGRNDSTYMRVCVNGVEQAFGKIRATEAWLVSLLGGLDAEGFMTAFVIRQKELDGLVKAKPAERRKLIERLAGIDRMSTAIRSAREEETEVKKRLELLPGNPEAVRATRQALDDAENRAIALWATYEERAAHVETCQATFAVAQGAATSLQERLDVHDTARQEAVAAEHALAMATERYEAATRDVERTTHAAAGGTDAEVAAAEAAQQAATVALQANQQAREGADRAVEQARLDGAGAAQAAERAQRSRAAANQAQQAAQSAQQDLAQFPADLAVQADQAERELAELTQTVGSLRGEHDRLTASIRAMEATRDGDSQCPTCSATLPDPDLVLNTLKETREKVAATGKAANERANVLGEQARTLRASVSRAEVAATAAHHLSEQAAAAERTAVDAERDAAEAATVAQRSAAAAEQAKAQAMDAAQQTAPLQVAVTQAADLLRRAQVAFAAAARLPELVAVAATSEEHLVQAKNRHVTATQHEVATRVDAAQAEQVFAAFHNAQQTLTEAEHAKVAANGDFRVAEEQVKAAEKERDAEALRMRARAEAHELLEQRTAVREALDYFRKDRIASLAPELSEIATDQIARMTDGKFTAIELDEEFTPVVTDAQGRQRPAAWLSGGEESAVALALRLAIGEVIAGTQGGLLWMDEPQTAMDAARRPAMMSVIRDLNGRQPIIISHVTEATDMVDLVVEVVPDESAGSTVVNTTSNDVIVVMDEAMLAAIDA